MKYESYKEFMHRTNPMSPKALGNDTIASWWNKRYDYPLDCSDDLTFRRLFRMLRNRHDLRATIKDAEARRILCYQIDSRLDLSDDLTYRAWLDVMDIIDFGYEPKGFKWHEL